MEPSLLPRSKKARERWKFLANVLTKNNNENDILKNRVSVRRFPGFGFFKAVEQRDCESTAFDFQTFEYMSNVNSFSSPRVRITVRKVNADLQISELSGFDNTGNICIWPSEEVLAYYMLKHKSDYEGRSVCELGAGMTALAGIMLAASCNVSEVYLTDGNQQSVSNIKKIISNNNFDDTKVQASKLIWDEDYTPSNEISKKFDVIVASDCLFYVKSHKGLIHTIDKLLAPKGQVILIAPYRSGTLQQFCNTAMDYFDVQVTSDYDELVSLKVSEAVVLNDMFEEDLHFPIMVKLYRKSLNTELEKMRIQDLQD